LNDSLKETCKKEHSQSSRSCSEATIAPESERKTTCSELRSSSNRGLGSAPTTTKKATWSWSVVFFQTRPDTTSTFFAQNGRFGRGRTFGRVLVVFWSCLVVFFGLLIKILWFLSRIFGSLFNRKL
jgi:hypothetical protein